MLGTEIGRAYDTNFWVNKWKEACSYFVFKNSNAKNILIISDDVRYTNEAEAIDNKGGYIFKVTSNKYAYQLNEDAKNHASEMGIPAEFCSQVIQNDDSLEKLVEFALWFIHSLE